MRIFAIEASGPVAGCALLDDSTLVAEFSVQYKKKHAQSLVPMMDDMRKTVGFDLDTVDAIAITAGPGSFTGLRIGAATAKGMGLALNIPIIAVPTVDALAYNLFGVHGLICPIMDARRKQVYTGIYRCEDRLEVVREQFVGPLEELTETLNAGGEPVIFLGDGVPAYENELSELMKVPYSFAPAHLSRQRAAATATLAYSYYEENGESCFTDPDEFRPEYLRLSQAERERGDKKNYSLV